MRRDDNRHTVSKFDVPIPVARIRHYFPERETPGVIPTAFQARHPTCQRTPDPCPDPYSGPAGDVREGLVGGVGFDVLSQAQDRREIGIVEEYDPTNVQHLVHIKEIDQRMIKGMPSIYYSCLNACSVGQ